MNLQLLWVVSMLYVADSFVLLLFAAGLSYCIGAIARREGAVLMVRLTERQVVKFIYFQLVLLFLTLVMFKWVVLSGGHGIETQTILAKGMFTRTFSSVAAVGVVVLSFIGALRWVRFLRRKVVLVWESIHNVERARIVDDVGAVSE